MLRFVAPRTVRHAIEPRGTGLGRRPYDAAMTPFPRRALAAALLLLAAGCGSSTASSTPAATTSAAASTSPTPSSTETATATPSAAAATSATRSPAASGSTASAAPGNPAGVRVDLQPVVTGLSAPLGIAAPNDGSGRLFVVQQGGQIRVVEDGRLLDRPFLDISSRISSGGERGLLGLALEPTFGQPGGDRFYVNDTDRDGNTVIAEYRVSASDPDVADPASERVLLHVDQPFANHNGGVLAFGPDGTLYAGLGDGGSGGDPMGNGQRLDTDLGKILRLDPLHASGATLAPADNPFAGRQGDQAAIWAYGLRNPWRLSFDRVTGDLWIGDVGQNAWEEIDVARRTDGGGKGLDFGWNRMEGFHCYPSGDSCDRSGLTAPIAEYGHDQGCAVVGGYVDRAPDAGPLSGVYVFSDNCSGRVWGLASGGPDRQDPVRLADSGRAISSFGEDATGRLYATDLSGGTLLRVVGTAR